MVAEAIENLENEDTHCCNMCGKRIKWDDNIWINSNFGICQDCYDRYYSEFPEDVKGDIEDWDYTPKARKYLDSVGSSY